MTLLPATRRADTFALALAIVLPTLVTWLYFIALRNQPAAFQQLAYGIGKTFQFGWPVAWAFVTGRLKLQWPRFESQGVWIGVLFGLTIAGTTLGIYHGWLKESDFFVGPAAAIRAKVTAIGIQSSVAFIALGAFYSLGHSWLEEYYWRWFVFGLARQDQLAPSFGLRRAESSLAGSLYLSLPIAIAISAIGFMTHHVLVLAMYFGWDSPATYLFSACVAIGGAVWAWLYYRTGSLYGAWFSHLLVDAGIFLVGYDVVRGFV